MGNYLFRQADETPHWPDTVVFVEGNISAGKSTLMKSLEEDGYAVYPEAVDRLTKEFIDKDGHNLLELFYGDMKKHAFDLQVASLLTRWKLIKEAIVTEKSRVVFIEKSLLTDRHTFAILLYERGCITDVQWKIYNALLEEQLSDAEYVFGGLKVRTIYLKTSPETCFKRKLERGRAEEDGLTIEYLRALHDKLEAWSGGPNADIIDGDQDKDTVLSSVLESLA
jgi:deoxyadenosine/deoxycytidine kinase